jgi:hypothetical protein
MQDRPQALSLFAVIVVFMALVAAGIVYEGASFKTQKTALAASAWNP